MSQSKRQPRWFWRDRSRTKRLQKRYNTSAITAAIWYAVTSERHANGLERARHARLRPSSIAQYEHERRPRWRTGPPSDGRLLRRREVAAHAGVADRVRDGFRTIVDRGRLEVLDGLLNAIPRRVRDRACPSSAQDSTSTRRRGAVAMEHRSGAAAAPAFGGQALTDRQDAATNRPAVGNQISHE